MKCNLILFLGLLHNPLAHLPADIEVRCPLGGELTKRNGER